VSHWDCRASPPILYVLLVPLRCRNSGVRIAGTIALGLIFAIITRIFADWPKHNAR